MIPSATNTRRDGAKVLIVEDNFSVANSLKYLLEASGFDVVGMAGNVGAALELVATLDFDLALLDIDLHGEHVAPVAGAVGRHGKPAIFLSGYGDADILPPKLRELPRLDKPIDPDMLFSVIETALAGKRSR